MNNQPLQYPLTTDITCRHSHTYVLPMPLPAKGETIQAHWLGQAGGPGASFVILGRLPSRSAHTFTTHKIFLSQPGSSSIFAASYYDDGVIAGLGTVERATFYDIPGPYVSQLARWRGAAQFLASLRRFLATAPA